MVRNPPRGDNKVALRRRIKGVAVAVTAAAAAPVAVVRPQPLRVVAGAETPADKLVAGPAPVGLRW